ncbi:MAG: ACT domain-containing protein, partial [Pseudomonas sp.]|nr:ACT domain-containing protein [Pseudomonas sp.]
LHMSLVGNDRPGIVHEVSQVLARNGVNVEQLNTECEPAPMSADLLFKAQARLGIHPQTDLDALRKDLENLADDLMVELTQPT